MIMIDVADVNALVTGTDIKSTKKPVVVEVENGKKRIEISYN